MDRPLPSAISLGPMRVSPPSSPAKKTSDPARHTSEIVKVAVNELDPCRLLYEYGVDRERDAGSDGEGDAEEVDRALPGREHSRNEDDAAQR